MLDLTDFEVLVSTKPRPYTVTFNKSGNIGNHVPIAHEPFNIYEGYCFHGVSIAIIAWVTGNSKQ